MYSNTCKQCDIASCESKKVLKRIKHHNIITLPEVLFFYKSTLACCKLSKKQKEIKNIKDRGKIDHFRTVSI